MGKGTNEQSESRPREVSFLCAGKIDLGEYMINA